jgi:hypothetical protein
VDKLHEHPKLRGQVSLRESFLKPKFPEQKMLLGLKGLLTAKERLLHGQGHRRYTPGEFREPKDSTLQKAFSTIRSSNYKLGVDHYGSPKLHEQSAVHPPGF